MASGFILFSIFIRQFTFEDYHVVIKYFQFKIALSIILQVA